MRRGTDVSSDLAKKQNTGKVSISGQEPKSFCPFSMKGRGVL